MVTIAAITKSTMMMMSTVKMPLWKVTDWMIACGNRETMLAKMSSDMPLPIPRWVMSSLIHMMNAVPATSVTTMTRFVNHIGIVPRPSAKRRGTRSAGRTPRAARFRGSCTA